MMEGRVDREQPPDDSTEDNSKPPSASALDQYFPQNEEEGSEDEQQDPAVKEDVQLGFAYPRGDPHDKILFETNDWHSWDGGKIGGKPVWLDPKTMPMPEELECENCRWPLTFLCQIYCPLDEPDQAFHRALYVFICQKPQCLQKGSVRALRCQLPRENPYYPFEPDLQQSAAAMLMPKSEVKLCQVCGMRGPHICGQCRQVHYCSRAHQKLHWKAGHKAACGTPLGGPDAATHGAAAAAVGSALLVEYEIEVQPEEEFLRTTAEDRKLIDRHLMRRRSLDAADPFRAEDPPAPAPEDPAAPPPAAPPAATGGGGAGAGGGNGAGGAAAPATSSGAGGQDDEDPDMELLTQREVDRASGAPRQENKDDPVTMAFLTRTSRASEQILRYARWGSGRPMWISSDHRPKIGEGGDIPPCPNCGAERQFEFQVMPQMLYYLNVADGQPKVTETITGGSPRKNRWSSDSTSEDSTRPAPPITSLPIADGLDWGTLAVYTCVASCQSNAPDPGPPSSFEEGADTVEEAHEANTTSYSHEFVWVQPPLR